MIYYAYVIYNLEHHRFYYGICTDLGKTELAHNDGLIEETRGISPWVMVHHEEFTGKELAIRRIRFFRTQAGQRYLKKILHY